MADVDTGAEMAKNIAKVLKAGRAGVTRDLEKVGLDLLNKLRADLSQPGRGATYSTLFFTDGMGVVHPYGYRPPHTASAPGDPPAVDTGQLRASYGTEVRREADGAVLTLGTGDEKAKYLEFGTSDMAARPHLRPVVARNQLTIRSTIEDGIEGRERAMARRLGGKG